MDADFNLAAYVLAAGQDRPTHPALAVIGQPVLDFGTLTARVRGMATGLRAAGLEPGRHVLLRIGNTADFPLAYLACMTAGLVPVPTSTALTPPELAEVLDQIKPALIIHSPDLAPPDSAGAPVLPTTALAAMAHLPPAAYHMGDPDRPGYIIFTSGTSGRPRAVVHAHRAILARRMMFNGWYGLTPDDRVMHAGAFNWTYTLGTGLMDPWTLGATALIPPAGTQPADLPGLMATHRATIFAAAPGVYRRMLRASFPPLPDLRHGLSAGEKLPDSLHARWTAATGRPVHEAFGMSECSTFLSGSPARPAPPGTLGYPQPGRRVRLTESGDIAIHRQDPGLMLGYLNQPAETAARFDGDWFLTGDIGTADPDGAIRYAGRADDMMNAGGTRVSPVEVEEALARHPAIAEVAAAEVRLRPDLSLIAAFYVSADVIDEDALHRFAAAHLADYKRPRVLVRVDQLPRGANNKLLRKVLRQNWEALHGQA